MDDKGDERIVLVAFVGADAHTFLGHHAKGIKLYCWLNPTATNPNGLRRLRRMGVLINSVDNLHIKLYWSRKRGAILGSANLSRNAFGDNSLHELAIHLPPGAIDVHQVLKRLVATPISPSMLDLFDKNWNLYRMRNPSTKKPKDTTHPHSFLDWFKAGGPWCRIYGWGSFDDAPRDAIAVVRQETGTNEFHDFIASGSKAHYNLGEWVLCFREASASSRSPYAHRFEWFIPQIYARTKVKRWKGFEHFWFQITPHLPSHPFNLKDSVFRSAFNQALAEIGNEIGNAVKQESIPTKTFLKTVKDRYCLIQKKSAI